MDNFYIDAWFVGVKFCLKSMVDGKFEIPKSLVLQITSSTLKDDGFVGKFGAFEEH